MGVHFSDEAKAELCVMIAKRELARIKGCYTEVEVEAYSVGLMARSDEEIEAEYLYSAQRKPTNADRELAGRGDVLRRHAASHGGRMALADAIAKGKLARSEVRDGTSTRQLEDIDALLRNPCAACESVRLEIWWAGSGYCSADCCLTMIKTGNDGARMYAQKQYDEWLNDPEA